MAERRSGSRRAWLVALGVCIALGAALAALRAIGVLAIERHVGFFAPVWDSDGRHVYWIQRETRGFVWGMGWEGFSPPASVYIETDELGLRRLDSTGGRDELLERFPASPVRHRVTHHYRGGIFNHLSAVVEPTPAGVDFRIRMNVPKVPSSEQWALRGSWAPGRPSDAAWSNEWAGGMGRPEAVLANGVELIAVKGNEGFPAGVLAVAADGSYRVLVQNADFDELYPDGVPPERIAERSTRAQIEHARRYRRVEGELLARFQREGANEGEAYLRAHDRMEELGLIPKDPRLVASLVSTPPPDVRVFEIPDEYLRVGLFQDIATAIATPGEEVRTGTGTYLKYYDDDLGPRLEAWRKAGHDRFGIHTGGQLYLLEVHRFDR